MNLRIRLLKLLPLAGLALAIGAARADTTITVGVGHMCCGGCRAAAKAALQSVAKSVQIDGKTVTVTLTSQDGNIVPALEALRKGGFPPTKVDAGAGPVTFGIAQLCCGTCKADLKAALTQTQIPQLDASAIQIGDNSVTLKAKAGSTLDIVPVMAAMEKGGFYASSISIGAAAASAKRHPVAVAKR
ncbi:MAG TPA: hypothetical protein VGS41_02385 [Chthonomonadales bacterium]|nr:hypothetical protein [Chthonomonadales bacterium]